MEHFENIIKSIASNVVDLTWSQELLLNNDFVQLYENPRAHRGFVTKFVAQDHHADLQKKIAILSVQTLALNDLVQFQNEMLTLLETGKVNAAVFEMAMFPSYSWSTLIAEKYKDPMVQGLLKRVLSSPAVSLGAKTYIETDILSGRAREDILELREMNEIP